MISLILITDDDDTQTESPSNFMMFFAVSALCCSTNICLSIYPLRMFLQCVRLCCSLFMWHCCAHTLTCIQMIPSMTDKNFRNLPNEMIKTCTTYYMFEVKTEKKELCIYFCCVPFPSNFFASFKFFNPFFSCSLQTRMKNKEKPFWAFDIVVALASSWLKQMKMFDWWS